MGFLERRVFPVLIISSTALCQLPSSRCDAIAISLADCSYVTQAATADLGGLTPLNQAVVNSDPLLNIASTDNQSNGFISSPRLQKKEHFHWGRALFESFTFLAIEQAYVVKDDYHWVVVENGVPLNHYWRDYKQSLSTWIHSGWDDGDPVLYSYVGHPIQGALTEYIQIQNDPQGRKLELSSTKLTVEKYGTVTLARRPWNHDGTWPCYQHCVTGVGQVDLVTTPVGGFAWQVTEDLLDKEIARRVEAATQNHFLIDVTRCALNPIRGGANILHGKRPWYRGSRDARQMYFSHHFRQPAVTVNPSE